VIVPVTRPHPTEPPKKTFKIRLKSFEDCEC